MDDLTVAYTSTVEPPLLKGGQGRSVERVKTDAVVVCSFMLVAFVLGAGAVLSVVMFQPQHPAPQINVEPSSATARSKFYFRPTITIDSTQPIKERVIQEVLKPEITILPSQVKVNQVLPDRLIVEVSNWPGSNREPPRAEAGGVLLPKPKDVR